MVSTPVEDSRRIALDAAGHLLQIKGWNALTAANIAEACGMSRQWLHALFGGQRALIEALVESVFGHWRSNQLEIMAARQPLADTIDRSFKLLLDSPPTVAIVLRQLSVESSERSKQIWADIHALWLPVWQSERPGNPEENMAATATFISASLALEQLVRTQTVDIATAKGVLINAVRGALRTVR